MLMLLHGMIAQAFMGDRKLELAKRLVQKLCHFILVSVERSIMALISTLKDEEMVEKEEEEQLAALVPPSPTVKTPPVGSDFLYAMEQQPFRDDCEEEEEKKEEEMKVEETNDSDRMLELTVTLCFCE
jgi:hypothetical protein